MIASQACVSKRKISMRHLFQDGRNISNFRKHEKQKKKKKRLRVPKLSFTCQATVSPRNHGVLLTMLSYDELSEIAEKNVWGIFSRHDQRPPTPNLGRSRRPSRNFRPHPGPTDARAPPRVGTATAGQPRDLHPSPSITAYGPTTRMTPPCHGRCPAAVNTSCTHPAPPHARLQVGPPREHTTGSRGRRSRGRPRRDRRLGARHGRARNTRPRTTGKGRSGDGRKGVAEQKRST
jgi:hypothetical protein